MEDIQLEGLANNWRERAISFTAALALAGALTSGCSLFEGEPEPGIVQTGADGKQYVLPEGAERPVYNSKEDCLADINEQIAAIEEELGEEIEENPEDLCEPADTYHGHTMVIYRPGTFFGPILSPGTRWDSPRVTAWDTNIGDRAFAAPGRPTPRGIVPAPVGSTSGQRVQVRGGFGGTAKGGFAHGASS